MRITGWTLTAQWDDGDVQDISCDVSEFTSKDIDYLCTCLEEKHNEEESNYA